MESNWLVRGYTIGERDHNSGFGNVSESHFSSPPCGSHGFAVDGVVSFGMWATMLTAIAQKPFIMDCLDASVALLSCRVLTVCVSESCFMDRFGSCRRG